MKKRLPPPTPELFALALQHRKITPSGCWEWTRSSNRGYGNFAGYPLHRLSYLVNRGQIQPDYHIHHNCDNKLCFNPDHLECVTSGENTRRYHRSVAEGKYPWPNHYEARNHRRGSAIAPERKLTVTALERTLERIGRTCEAIERECQTLADDCRMACEEVRKMIPQNSLRSSGIEAEPRFPQ